MEVSVPSGLDRKETEIYRQLDPRRLPQHIAIIMDGNGRWARQRHLPRIAGHRAGVDAVRSTVETAARVGIQSLTLYAFSTENWQRRPRPPPPPAAAPARAAPGRERWESGRPRWRHASLSALAPVARG